MRIKMLTATTAALMLVIAGCGGNSVEDKIAEQIAESNDGVSNVDIDSDSGDFNMTIEGDDGETINVTGSGDDEEFNMTIEGEDGETMTIGGGEIPDGMATPVPDGGDVVSSMTASGMISVAIEYPASMFDELVDMYDGIFSGDDVQRFETSSSSDGGTQKVVTWASADGSAQVTVADCESMGTGDADAVCVSVLEINE